MAKPLVSKSTQRNRGDYGLAPTEGRSPIPVGVGTKGRKVPPDLEPGFMSLKILVKIGFGK